MVDCAMVQDWWKIDALFNEAKPRWIECWFFSELKILYHCTNQYHSPFVLHNTSNVNKIELDWRILYLGWVKFHSVSSSWINIASARPTCNTRTFIIHKTILSTIRSYKSTVIRSAKLLWQHTLLKNETAGLCHGTISWPFNSHIQDCTQHAY